MKYYVYRHIRLDRMTPYYVGKGQRSRCTNLKRRNSKHTNITNKHGCRAEIVMRFEKEKDAFDFECKLIKLYKSLGYCEANMTDGGEGPSGFIHSEETKLKMKKSHSLRDHSRLSSMSKSRLGTKRPKAERQAISDGRRGLKFSEDHRRKLSDAKIGKRSPRWRGYCITPFGTFETVSEAANKLSMSGRTILNRCNSSTFPEWFTSKEL